MTGTAYHFVVIPKPGLKADTPLSGTEGAREAAAHAHLYMLMVNIESRQAARRSSIFTRKLFGCKILLVTCLDAIFCAQSKFLTVCFQDFANATNEVRAAYDQLNSARTFFGSTLDQFNASQDFLNTENLQLTQQSSDLVGVDMNQAATNLTNAEAARNAALQADASIGNLSLFNYLTTSSSGE
jgi:flagellin-like hook-associated protein FlgL